MNGVTFMKAKDEISMQGLLGGGEAVEEELKKRKDGYLRYKDLDLILSVQVLYHLSILKECITSNIN
jgi:hypothetical protein